MAGYNWSLRIFLILDEFDDDDLNNDDLFSIGKKVKIELADMDYTLMETRAGKRL